MSVHLSILYTTYSTEPQSLKSTLEDSAYNAWMTGETLQGMGRTSKFSMHIAKGKTEPLTLKIEAKHANHQAPMSLKPHFFQYRADGKHGHSVIS